jgi:Phosphoglucose isomerase
VRRGHDKIYVGLRGLAQSQVNNKQQASNMAWGVYNAGQALALLQRHATDEEKALRSLPWLCRDDHRVSSLVTVVHPKEGTTSRMLLLDLSRQHFTEATLPLLLEYATACELHRFIRRLAYAPKDPIVVPVRNNASRKRISEAEEGEAEMAPNSSSSCPSMHLALRVPRKHPVPGSVHAMWDRIRTLSDALRQGTRAVQGHRIRDVVVVGQGVAMEALRFVYQAWMRDETAFRATLFEDKKNDSNHMARLRRNLMESSLVGTVMNAAAGVGETATEGCTSSSSQSNHHSQQQHRGRRLHFLSTIDPVATRQVMTELDATSALVISVALRGSEETGLATRTLKTWLLQSLGNNRHNSRADAILEKHMILVTGNDRVAQAINRPDSVFLIPPEHRYEPFTSFTPITLLVRLCRQEDHPLNARCLTLACARRSRLPLSLDGALWKSSCQVPMRWTATWWIRARGTIYLS